MTELIGVPGRTLSFVSENAQVVTAEGPPPEQGPTQIARYQAVALKGPPEVGTVNFAFSVLVRAALTSKNMNS